MGAVQTKEDGTARSTLAKILDPHGIVLEPSETITNAHPSLIDSANGKLPSSTRPYAPNAKLDGKLNAPPSDMFSPMSSGSLSAHSVSTTSLPHDAHLPPQAPMSASQNSTQNQNGHDDALPHVSFDFSEFDVQQPLDSSSTTVPATNKAFEHAPSGLADSSGAHDAEHRKHPSKSPPYIHLPTNARPDTSNALGSRDQQLNSAIDPSKPLGGQQLMDEGIGRLLPPRLAGSLKTEPCTPTSGEEIYRRRSSRRGGSLSAIPGLSSSSTQSTVLDRPRPPV